MFGTLFYGLLNFLMVVAAIAAGAGVLFVGLAAVVIACGCVYCDDGRLDDVQFIAGVTYSKELTEAIKKMSNATTEMCKTTSEFTRMAIAEKKEEDDWYNYRKADIEAEDFSED